MKRRIALFLAVCLLLGSIAGCAAKSEQATPPADDNKAPATTTSAEKKTEARDVDLAFFTGKVETVDLIDEMIADFNAQSNGVTVEQEYQNDASNIIKIKFDSICGVPASEFRSEEWSLDLCGAWRWRAWRLQAVDDCL